MEIHCIIWKFVHFQVVRDCIDDVCTRLDIADQVEIEEYTLFLRTRDGQFSRLRSEEYILDVTAELLRSKRDYDLVFQRTVWYFPFRSSDNLLYNELMYFQVPYNIYVTAYLCIMKYHFCLLVYLSYIQGKLCVGGSCSVLHLSVHPSIIAANNFSSETSCSLLMKLGMELLG